MKNPATIGFALACVVLGIVLFMTKQSDNTQHASDTAAIYDLSNTLTAAQSQVATGIGTMLTLSNRLDESQSASLTLSNQLTEAGSTIALNAEQITNLNGQVAQLDAENQTLSGRLMDLTNQMAGLNSLTNQIASVQAGLNQANQEYSLLENRLRRDVAERLVVERKFNNLSELQKQVQNLKDHPGQEISAGSIYAGLDLEVTSNAVHVIAPQ